MFVLKLEGKFKKWLLPALAALFAAALIVTGYLIRESGGFVITAEIEEGGDGFENPDKAGEKAFDGEGAVTSEDEIKVFITGCVKKPGIVTLKRGQIIDDAVKAAGGFTEEADAENINLVYALNENTWIRVRAKDEEAGSEETAGAGSGTGARSLEAHPAGTGVEIRTDSGGAVLPEDIKDKTPAIVNINTGTLEELVTLPGIGEKTARDIIEYRNKNGPFERIEDIMNVSGIGPKKFESLKGLIRVK